MKFAPSMDSSFCEVSLACRLTAFYSLQTSQSSHDLLLLSLRRVTPIVNPLWSSQQPSQHLHQEMKPAQETTFSGHP